VNELHLENITLTGLGSFVSNEFNFTARFTPFVATFQFDLSLFFNIQVDNVMIGILIEDMIPLYGGGALELGIDNLRIKGQLDVALSTPVTINTMEVDVSIDNTAFDISNTMYLGGTEYAKTFSSFMSETTPQIFENSVVVLLAHFKDLVNNYTKENNISLNDSLLSKS
ncbi:hypothetical protein L9F63_017614, partial [Diploptera punctata]